MENKENEMMKIALGVAGYEAYIKVKQQLEKENRIQVVNQIAKDHIDKKIKDLQRQKALLIAMPEVQIYDEKNPDPMEKIIKQFQETKKRNHSKSSVNKKR